MKESESGSHSVVSDSLRYHGLYSPWNSPGQNPGVGGLCLLQGIFPSQGLNPRLPHCRALLHQLSYEGNSTLGTQSLKNPSAKQENRVQSLDWEDPLEKEIITHFQYSCLGNSMAKEPGRLRFMGW